MSLCICIKPRSNQGKDFTGITYSTWLIFLVNMIKSAEMKRKKNNNYGNKTKLEAQVSLYRSPGIN